MNASADSNLGSTVRFPAGRFKAGVPVLGFRAATRFVGAIQADSKGTRSHPHQNDVAMTT